MVALHSAAQQMPGNGRGRSTGNRALGRVTRMHFFPGRFHNLPSGLLQSELGAESRQRDVAATDDAFKERVDGGWVKSSPSSEDCMF